MLRYISKLFGIGTFAAHSKGPMLSDPECDALLSEATAARRDWRPTWERDKLLLDAKRLFREVTERFPDCWRGHYGLGEILTLQARNALGRTSVPIEQLNPSQRVKDIPGMRAAGIKALKTADKLDPNQADVLVRLAAELTEDDVSGAMVFYRRALKLLEKVPASSAKPESVADHARVAYAAAIAGNEEVGTDW